MAYNDYSGFESGLIDLSGKKTTAQAGASELDVVAKAIGQNPMTFDPNKYKDILVKYGIDPNDRSMLGKITSKRDAFKEELKSYNAQLDALSSEYKVFDMTQSAKQKEEDRKEKERLQGLYSEQIDTNVNAISELQAKLSDKSYLDNIYEMAKTQSRDRLASEYSARGISGRSYYNPGMAKVYAELDLKKSQESRNLDLMVANLEKEKTGLRNSELGMGMQSFQTSQAAYMQGQNLLMQQGQMDFQQEQFDWNKNIQQQQLDLQESKNLWSTLGSLGGIALGAALAPATGGTSLIGSAAAMGGLAAGGASTALTGGAYTNALGAVGAQGMSNLNNTYNSTFGGQSYAPQYIPGTQQNYSVMGNGNAWKF